MEAELKARELIDMFMQFTPADENYELSYAKQCALIAVEQAILYHPFPNEPDERDKKFHTYWQSVIEAINKL